MTFRRIVSTAVLVATSVTLVVAMALMELTTLLHTVTAQMAAAVESVHIAQNAKSDLLLREHSADPLVRASIESRLEHALNRLQAHVTTPSEAAMLEQAGSTMREYLMVDPQGAEVAELHVHAFGLLDRLVAINITQARDAQAHAARWNLVADVIGIAAIVLLATMCAGLLWWLKARALRPLIALGDAMQRFGSGQRSARAEEAGPEELRLITRQFNDMAGAIAAHRESMMALLAGVAHDLRTPLSALSLSLGMVRPNQPLPEEPRLRQTLATARRQTARLERMLADFLDFARVEAGTLELRREDCDLCQIAREVVALYDSPSGSSRIELSCPDGPVPLHCDPGRVEQVLGNLISNALKYSQNTTTVRVVVSEREGEVVLEVSDHGVGIPVEDQARVFEPFRRTLISKAKASGAGLGLFVVRTIMEAHGGSIDLESTPGKGTTVSVRFPASVAPASSIESPLVLH